MSLERADRPYAAVRREYTAPVAFSAFTRAFESLLGIMSPDLLANPGSSPADARERLAHPVASSGFALFQKLDHGRLLAALGLGERMATTYVLGNALIAVEMTRHAPAIGLYVPPRIYVEALDEGRVVVTYDLLSTTVAQFGSPEADKVAWELDVKLERLIENAASLAGDTPDSNG